MLCDLSDYERERGKPIPTLNHTYVQSNLLVELTIRYRKSHTFLSELNVSMPERPDIGPDIVIYPKLEVDFLHDISFMTKMPMTVIEIVSPSQSNDDILAKFERYFKAGITSCWLVLPSLKAIAVYAKLGKYRFFTDDMSLSDSATGIELTLSSIFS